MIYNIYFVTYYFEDDTGGNFANLEVPFPTIIDSINEIRCIENWIQKGKKYEKCTIIGIPALLRVDKRSDKPS